MSLKNFLAVGQSFSSGGAGKSPYEMRKENLLPRFGQRRRATEPASEASQPQQADWLDETPRAQETATMNEGTTAPAPCPAPAASATPAAPAAAGPITPGAAPERKGLWYYLTFGFLRRKTRRNPLLIQSELMLENVRVVRNDLADSDLELVVVKKKKKRVEPIFNPSLTNPEGNWNALTARLFDLGQKRR